VNDRRLAPDGRGGENCGRREVIHVLALALVPQSGSGILNKGRWSCTMMFVPALPARRATATSEYRPTALRAAKRRCVHRLVAVALDATLSPTPPPPPLPPHSCPIVIAINKVKSQLDVSTASRLDVFPSRLPLFLFLILIPLGFSVLCALQAANGRVPSHNHDHNPLPQPPSPHP
jgi:hypothetical protein